MSKSISNKSFEDKLDEIGHWEKGCFHIPKGKYNRLLKAHKEELRKVRIDELERFIEIVDWADRTTPEPKMTIDIKAKNRLDQLNKPEEEE